MNAKTTLYVPLTSDNAALVLVDHQVGLLTGVRDISVAELKNNVVSLAKAMRTLKVPTIVTTTARESMWGPTFPELVPALPDIKIIDRNTVNAWDDPRVAAAIEATDRDSLEDSGVGRLQWAGPAPPDACPAFSASLHRQLHRQVFRPWHFVATHAQAM